ncbi:hypothetical protein CDAR_574741 [Caerostris darwini]|uniref:Ig-like domain-containing protein n=1 Tax=Caerostris darwini TaxID=1538125 RepID=A0AAV4SZW3_9ARAC|nr:hypothetical protein CDAR_574741 [Caerostris darwini]
MRFLVHHKEALPKLVQVNDTPAPQTTILRTRYAPQLRLALGTSNQHSAIKEGNDVYFECNIKANPAVSEVSWYADDEHLSTNLSRGILVNNQSLILQKVGRENRGMYRCRATNTEGEGDSDVVKLDIQCEYSFCFSTFEWNGI